MVKPFVSVCTPTFNRRPFIMNMIQCFQNQTYPKDRLEWIIVDDGTDKIKDLIDAANIPQIKYFTLEKKMALGEKRNYMHTHCKGAIIVYMDDDDYYPPERISHAVQKLQENPNALCAGSSEIYIYFKHIQKMYQAGPYSPTHATAGTFAFRKELLNQTKYEDKAALAEERLFLKNYTIPFVQLDPLKTILVFSHEHNTFDKRKMLEHKNQFFKESSKNVDLFVKEPEIKEFFMNKIDNLLKNYEAGEPKMKPDVLEQIKIIDEERKKMTQEPQITMNVPGQPPRIMSKEEIVSIIQQQQQQLQQQQQEIDKLQKQMNDQQNIQKTLVEQYQEIYLECQQKDEEIKKLKKLKTQETQENQTQETQEIKTKKNQIKEKEKSKTQPEIFVAID